jgi:hypothetical protein
LLNYIKANGELDNLPNGMHAVVPRSKARPDARRDFALRNIHDSVNVNQQNRLHLLSRLCRQRWRDRRRSHPRSSACST